MRMNKTNLLLNKRRIEKMQRIWEKKRDTLQPMTKDNSKSKTEKEGEKE